MSFKIKEYKAYLTDENGEETGELKTFRDYEKEDAPNKGRVFVATLYREINGKRFWHFASATDIPAHRYLAVNAIVQLSAIETTTDDLKQGFAKVQELLTEGKTADALKIAQNCNTIIALSDPIERYLNLASVFLFLDDENPMYFDEKKGAVKRKLFDTLKQVEKVKICEWVRDYFDISLMSLADSYPECFKVGEVGDVVESVDFINTLQNIQMKVNQFEDYIHHLTKGVGTEKDALLSQPTSAYFAAMAVYIRNVEKLNN